MSLPVELHVWDFTLPAERHLSVINWAAFPGQTYGHLIPAGDNGEYFRRYREFCEFLVRHRQTDVMGALDWIARRDAAEGAGYDTSRLEQHADVAFAAGIRQMHLHAAGEKTAPILDPRSRVTVPERDDGPRRLSPLRALEETIQRRGWQRRFLVAITDEPFIHHEETFAAAVEQVRQAAPSVRTVEAVETDSSSAASWGTSRLLR